MAPCDPDSTSCMVAKAGEWGSVGPLVAYVELSSIGRNGSYASVVGLFL
jgi:hypothetical protein